ncbi:MAG: hypothetical protein QM531_04235 [Candidatus Pacebacteria bacterium]|nr:hypothetical protein [Candidatus Paceibacterota bacterium]
MLNKSKLVLGATLVAMAANSSWSADVVVSLDQIVPIYSSSSFSTAIVNSAATIQIGKIGVSESSLAFGSRAAFDTFLGSAAWSRYGSSVPYIFDGSYKFTSGFEPFVENYGSTSATLPEQPYQLYVAITSGSDLFGMYTWRGDGGQVSRFALTADDEPYFSMENIGSTGGVLNMVAVNDGLGSVRVQGGIYGEQDYVASAISLIPEPSSGSLLLLGAFSLAIVNRLGKSTRIVKA